MRSLLPLLLASAAVRGAAERVELPAPIISITEHLPKPLAQRIALGYGSLALLKRAARGSPPPLRSVLGGREESTLVAEAPPNGVAIFCRAVALLLIFLPVLLTAPLAWLIRPFRAHVWFWLIKSSLARAGTAFIKWGQWASVRPDMFPERLCAALAELHSRAPVHGFAHTRREVEESLGAPLEEVFYRFDEKPVASGSIAQVHRADIDGKLVAVKVRHPRVVERIVTDFTLMRMIADSSAKISWLSWLNLKQSVEQFSGTMVAQTRLDIEGEHLNRFNWNFGTAAWRDCAFPKVITPGGVPPSRAVLVETFEPGELVSKYTVEQTLGLQGAASLDPENAHFIVSRGEDTYLKMLLVDNLMHADLHPGNILLDAPSRKSRRIVLLDVGMVARLTTAEAEAFIGLLHAVGAGSGRAAAKAVLRFSNKQEVCVGKEKTKAFADDMHELFLERCKGYGTGVQFGEVLRGVLNLVRRHRVALDANYMTLVMNVLCLEGMAGALLPDYNVLDAARPLLATHRRLPRPLFKMALPLVCRLKRIRDGVWAAKSHKRKPSEDETPTAEALGEA